MINDQDVQKFLEIAERTLLHAKGTWQGMASYVAQGKLGAGQLVVIRVDDSVDVPEHIHDYDEFCLVLQGRVVTWIAGREYVSEPGDLLHEPANIPHRARIEGPYVAIDFFASARFETESTS